jgi:hypothetical protein
MHEYLISFTRVDYIQKLTCKIYAFKLRAYRGRNFFGKLSEEKQNYTKELCGGIP